MVSCIHGNKSTKLIIEQLTKEDEAATGGDEVEVRREDQDKINKFSRLHQREMALEEEVKSKQVSCLHHMGLARSLTRFPATEGEGRS